MYYILYIVNPLYFYAKDGIGILIKTIKLGIHRDRVLSSMHAARKSQARIGLIEKILRLNKMQV
jgi:hypothetical protein